MAIAADASLSVRFFEEAVVSGVALEATGLAEVVSKAGTGELALASPESGVLAYAGAPNAGVHAFDPGVWRCVGSARRKGELCDKIRRIVRVRGKLVNEVPCSQRVLRSKGGCCPVLATSSRTRGQESFR